MQARTALRKLRELGLYKSDLRKTPGRAQLKKIAEFADVLSGNATVVQPKSPGRFKGIYKTVGNNVIVPRRKGEKISVDKSGEIISKRKSGKRIIKGRGRKLTLDGADLKRPIKTRTVQYVIPFHGHNGETNWFRFPDYDELKKFMADYKYKDWKDYVIEEDIENPIDDDELDERIERKRKGRPIKGGFAGKKKSKKKVAKKSAKGKRK